MCFIGCLELWRASDELGELGVVEYKLMVIGYRQVVE